MKSSRLLKLVTGLFEGFLAIPILGWFVATGFAYTPLIIMFILHIVTIIVSSNERTSIVGSVTGVIASVLGWIPVLGMFIHFIAFVVLILDGLFGGTKKEDIVVSVQK